MEPMKLDIQMFAPDVGTVDINVNFKDISEDELPENLIIAFDTWEVTIPISGLYTNYVWNHFGTFVFDIISIVTEGYSIIAYQIGNGIINIDVYKNNAFTRKIIDDNAINQSEPNFSQVATTDEGMFTAEDNDGISTYFRGAVTNNYVKFANFWWRIIRVNGNGSVRLIYDGTTAHANGDSSIDRIIGTSSWCNIPYANEIKYCQYTWDNGECSPKTILDNWYQNNLKNYENYMDIDVGFYNDVSLESDGSSTSLNFSSLKRMTSDSPSLYLSEEGYRYTVSASQKGNKELTYPIGMLTGDELMMAGAKYSDEMDYNQSFYIWRNNNYLLTMTPLSGAGSRPGFYPKMVELDPAGEIYTSTYIFENQKDIVPVINLRGDLSVTGTGTSTDPYEVSLPAVPTTNFNGTELTDIYYNGTALTEVYFNNVLVFSKQSPPYSPNLRTIQVGDAFWEGTSLTLDIPGDTSISEYSKIVNGADISIEANPNPQMIALLCDRGNTVAQSQIFYPDLGINIGKISDLDFRSPETPSYKVQDTITSVNSTHEVYPYIRVDTATLYRDGVVLVRYYDLDDNYIFKDFDTWADFYSWCYANKNNIHAIEIYTYGTTDTIFFNDLFSGSTSIISVDLQHMRDISGTVSCAHAFENCPNLEFFRCGEFEIQSAAYMFYNDTALNDCMLGYCKGIHNLEQTWAHCSSLTEISLLNETTGETVSFTNVGSMEDTFYNSGLTNFDFHYWTNPTLNTLGTTFSNTSSNLVVDFYNLNIEDVAMQGVNQINGSGTAKFFAPVSFDYTVIDFLFSDWRVSYYDKHGYTTGPTGEPA